MIITNNQKEILDKLDISSQKVGLGTILQEMGLRQAKQPQIVEFEVTADATGGLSISVPYAMRVFDVIVECRAANAGGTLTLRSGTNSITDAVICAVDKVITRAGTIDDTYSSITTATELNVIANGAADRGMITILGFPS